MSEKKEPHYFAFQDGIPRYQGPRDRQRMQHQAVISSNEYEELFAAGANRPARGEASAMYLYMPGVAKQIHRVLPATKLIAILRNPVERAYSAYLHHLRDNVETLSFEEAFEQDVDGKRDSWMPLWHYAKMGLYCEQLKRYLTKFPRDQIRIYLYEDLCSHPEDLLTDIFQFLDLDSIPFDKQTQRYNVSGVPRSRWLHRLLTEPSKLKSTIRQLVPRSWLYGAVNSLKVRNLGKAPSMSRAARERLMEYYRSDIWALQELICRDLSHWCDESDSIHRAA